EAELILNDLHEPKKVTISAPSIQQTSQSSATGLSSPALQLLTPQEDKVFQLMRQATVTSILRLNSQFHIIPWGSMYRIFFANFRSRIAPRPFHIPHLRGARRRKRLILSFSSRYT